jgi:plastocyanin
VSVSAQNNSTEQQPSADGSNDTANDGNSTNSTAAGTKVSIVEEASEMGDQAYDPSPIKVKVGNTVTWTNDESQIHTVTSGTDAYNSHKFMTVGEFPYFCQLYPTMVGKVVVS